MNDFINTLGSADFEALASIEPLSWFSVLMCMISACFWIVAAVGVLIGPHFELVAFKLSILTVPILVGIDYGESSIKWLQRGVHRRTGISKEKQEDREASNG